MTADGRALATVQAQKSSAIYMGQTPTRWPGEIKLSSTPLTPGQAEGGWFDWGGDGKIYFTDADFHALRMNPDGSGRVRVPDRDTNATYPVFCGSEAIVFATLRDNRLNLFRQNLTTGEIKQLTSERDAEWPWCTRDGKTVYYVDNLDGAALKRISTSGGMPEAIAQQSAAGAALSPDETRITYFQYSVTGEHKNLIVVENVDGSNRITLPATGLVLRPDWRPMERH